MNDLKDHTSSNINESLGMNEKQLCKVNLFCFITLGGTYVLCYRHLDF